MMLLFAVLVYRPARRNIIILILYAIVCFTWTGTRLSVYLSLRLHSGTILARPEMEGYGSSSRPRLPRVRF